MISQRRIEVQPISWPITTGDKFPNGKRSLGCSRCNRPAVGPTLLLRPTVTAISAAKPSGTLSTVHLFHVKSAHAVSGQIRGRHLISQSLPRQQIDQRRRVSCPSLVEINLRSKKDFESWLPAQSIKRAGPGCLNRVSASIGEPPPG